jgi:hypothetical protein
MVVLIYSTLCNKSSDPCGLSVFRKSETQSVKFCVLNNYIQQHCFYLKISVPDWSERDLVCNRIGKTCADDDLICPKHRYKFGIHFKSSALYHHPEHQKKNGKVKTAACSEY